MFNVVITLLFLTLIIFALKQYGEERVTQIKRREAVVNKAESSIPAQRIKDVSKAELFIEKYKWFFFGGILLIAAIIRFIDLPNIPAGFNQDEAAIAYDSFALKNYGVDRNGYHFPVYPVSWGAGQGPFYMYFAIPFMWIFGDNVLGFRMGNVVLSLLSVACVFLMMRKSFNTKTGLVGMLLFAIAPWNIFLSRWALDANPLPSMFIIALCIFTYAIANKRTSTYLLASAMLAFTLYTYGTSYVVIPLFLVLMIPYLLYHKKITVKQTILSGAVFVVVSIPLILFLMVNYFGMNEIVTDFISVPKLTVMRSDAIFRDFSVGGEEIVKSVNAYNDMVLMQKPDFPWNSVEEYGIIYMFSLPLILLGVVVALVKTKIKEFNNYYFYIAMFVSASVLVLLIDPNINRGHVVFVPVICLIAIAIMFISKHIKWSLPAIIAPYLIAFVMFSNYYVTDYNNLMSGSFVESFDQAVKYADNNTDGKIYVSGSVNGGYILTLFHTQYDPIEFNETVQYYDDNAEFRHAISFGNYVFEIPEEKIPDGYYVIPNHQTSEFNEEVFTIESFKNFSVAYPK